MATSADRRRNREGHSESAPRGSVSAEPLSASDRAFASSPRHNASCASRYASRSGRSERSEQPAMAKAMRARHAPVLASLRRRSRRCACLSWVPGAIDVDVRTACRTTFVGPELEPNQRDPARRRENEDLAEEHLAEILDDDAVVVDLGVRVGWPVPVDLSDQRRVEDVAVPAEQAPVLLDEGGIVAGRQDFGV